MSHGNETPKRRWLKFVLDTNWFKEALTSQWSLISINSVRPESVAQMRAADRCFHESRPPYYLCSRSVRSLTNLRLIRSQSIPKERTLITQVQQFLVSIHRSDFFVRFSFHEFVLLLILLPECDPQHIRHHDRTAANCQTN